jgi:two-component system sensor histidine kinase YesM
MKQAEGGDLDVKFHSHYKDEIGELGRSFNSMLERLKNLMKQNYDKQKKLRTQELKVLQMQINPHFLYNTIDTINWMAQSIDADRISEISIELANYYRQSLSKGAEIIKIKDEISQINSYLIIQKTRYEGHINFKMDIDENILELYIPKLTLQPILENAIYHGLREKEGGGIIEIKGFIKENQVIFIIRDSGKGMEEETLNKLIKCMNEGGSSQGYGLSNVNERLKLYFGGEYGLNIESVKDSYTTVTVNIPIVEQEDQYANFD